MVTVIEEWIFEVGDGTVGIFGEWWIHNTCPVEDADGTCEEWIVEAVRISPYDRRYVTRLVCNDCGAEHVITEDAFDPPESWWDEMDATHAGAFHDV